MSSLFDIDGSQIAQLSDSDLRSLVARLCEVELLRAGFCASAVTAGGHQDAADGGLDVRVALPRGVQVEGFVPRASTGFQVKVPDMARAAILDEMRPTGRVRPVIEDLVRESGAYVIVSAKGSTSDSALRQRRDAMRDAMRDAVADVPGSDALEVDFYDRERLAMTCCHSASSP